MLFGFLGWIPGSGGSLTERRSRLYWASMYPIQVLDYKISTNGAELHLQNVADETIVIKKIAADDMEGVPTAVTTTITASPGLSLAPGEAKTFRAASITCKKAGSKYSLDFSIMYDVAGGITGQILDGEKPLVGTCTE